MPKFSLREPNKGDIIRVKVRNDIYHYGIYVCDDEVIEFGEAKDIFKNKDDVLVKKTSIKEFLNNGFLEVREYTFLEKIRKNKPDKVISLARSRIGNSNYDLLNNNCEHFVNECVFNKHISFDAKKYSENC